ncbi:MAG: aminomethyl transferase family protein [Thermomicrobium sp.]|nr:aminomethyl transferase family protein [Thermomicrobium sp.]MDW7982509.1 aminomethyl transferase family protein [Thermomicrobium sp.]
MTATTAPRSLQELLDRVPRIVDHLFANPKGVLRAIVHSFPPDRIPLEFTNWRDEQRARRETVALLDQSFHMTNLWVRGRDAQRLVERLGTNRFRRFGPGKAKQFVACTPEGYVIGDNVLYCLSDSELLFVGGEPVLNWVEYHARTGGEEVEVERDPLWSQNATGRRTVYRFQIEGPRAPQLMAALHGRPLPELPFFHHMELTLAGLRVRVLRHSMAGVPGFELSGPWDEREALREAIREAGAAFGLQLVGSFAYLSSGGLESGWIPRPLPAIYTSPALRPYREWLPATGYEATGALGGSFYSEVVDDYYLTPFELGLGHLVAFDHDFIGREALERHARTTRRCKVTLVWHPEDVTRIVRSVVEPGTIARYLDLPWLHYASWQYDAVLDPHGNPIGLGLYAGYSANERAILTLAVIDHAWSEPGTEVILVWGEDGGGTRSRPWIDLHEPVSIRATVQPAPISAAARAYRTRTRST